MKIQFLGGAQTVTGSQYLVTVNDHKILLECGLFQGRRSETYEKNLNFEFDPADVDAVLLSHAHIDHSGNLPNLHKNGFKKHIYATAATVDLCQLMLRDSGYLHEKDVEWINKNRASKHEEPIEPLYTIEDAEAALRLFVGVQYHRPIEVAPGVTATFNDAGHILGSASIVLDLKEGRKTRRLGFSGDVGRKDMPIIRDPEPPTDLDALIMESTYGDREHADDSGALDELADVVLRTIKKGGKLIIPAFAVGRTQRLVYSLHELRKKSRIPKIPVFVDSPMACNATDVYRSHPECFDREAYFRFVRDTEDVFTPPGFTCVRKAAASKKLNFLTDPHIIVAASGMAEGGRILHHLKNNLEDERNTLLFVGFAAEHTLARRIMDGEKEVKVFGEKYNVECDVVTMPYFSAHGDRDDLIEFLTGTPPKTLKKVFLVHGEKSQQFALKERIEEKGYKQVRVPARLDSFSL
ncbi:MAG: MBL fold metallo-hydrolase [Candidatus Latescibacterota bacterium]|nr:MAG: MBL fold metallo-hydrolase [Candidatus Latescibacterota bacterium]